MMATLLELANRTLPEIGLPTLTALRNNSNQTAQRTLALANTEGRSLATHPWRILVKRHIITTASSVDAYGFPNDFNHFVDRTSWNDTSDDIVHGPIGDIQWQADISGITTSTIDQKFQVRADGNLNRFFINPMPTSADDVTFFYVSNGWCRSNGGTRQNEWNADTDVLLLPEFVYCLGLKYRLLRAQRRDYTVEFAEYQRELAKEKARDGGMAVASITMPPDDFTPHASIPDTGYGA